MFVLKTPPDLRPLKAFVSCMTGTEVPILPLHGRSNNWCPPPVTRECFDSERACSLISVQIHGRRSVRFLRCRPPTAQTRPCPLDQGRGEGIEWPAVEAGLGPRVGIIA